MITMQFVAAAICISVLHGDISWDDESDRYLLGDLIYFAVDVQNQSGAPMDIMTPAPGLNCDIEFLHDGEVISFFSGRTPAHSWSVQLQDGESVRKTFVFSPRAKFESHLARKANDPRGSGDRILRRRPWGFRMLFTFSPRQSFGELAPPPSEFDRLPSIPGTPLWKRVVGSATLDELRNESLYHSWSDTDRDGRPRVTVDNQYLQEHYRWYSSARSYDRMLPVSWRFFGVNLSLWYAEPENFSHLVTRLNPESKLFRLCRLVEMANEWVQTPDGAERLVKERDMLLYASEGGSIEAEYLIGKIKELIATKEREQGPYIPPTPADSQ